MLLSRPAASARDGTAHALTDHYERRPRPSPRRAAAPAALAACLLALWFAPAALAHAQLVGTSPQSGTTVASQPKTVIFEFNEAVGGTLGAVRVYDARGDEVDDLNVTHPQGRSHWMGVGLKAHLPDGTYTATYRVVSADTHVVYGGLVFNVGHAGALPAVTVPGLIARGESGHVTKVAFGVVRALDYLSIALLLGGLAFLLIAWLPALSALADERTQWLAASAAFARRLRRLLYAAAALGFVVSVLGVLLQGASAAGVSLWTSLKSSVLQSTLESRFGTVWTVRAADWLAIAAVLAIAGAMRRPLVPAAALAREDTAPPSRVLVALLALGAGYLALTPALAGHASQESPRGVFFPSDVLHVLSASVWVGGIACLLLAMPAATRELDGPDRARLLLGTLSRFSPLALAAVLTIAVTGVLQAYIDVRSLHALLHSTYGALIIVKVALLLALIAFGWVNRERVLPALQRVVDARLTPGLPGVLARRTMRGELAVMIGVLGVTAALISYTPPIDQASGPYSTTALLGPAQLEMTVEPAEVGANSAHLYLIDAKTGTPFTQTRELTATASLPAKRIGPLPLKLTRAGPGHYILSSAVLSPAGSWHIAITDRVSEFEQHTRTLKVPIR
jgi:copper transport protein